MEPAGTGGEQSKGGSSSPTGRFLLLLLFIFLSGES